MSGTRTSTAGTIALTALAPAAWGTTYYVTTEWLPPDRPLLAAVIRALPAGVALAAFGRRLPHGVWWWRTLALGTLNIGLFFALLFVSAYRLPGGVAATLGAVQPLLVAVLAVGLLQQRLSVRAVVCGAAGVLGVALLVLRADAALDGFGVVAGLLGAGSMALGVVLAKRWGRPPDVGVLPFTGWLLTAGGVVLLPLMLVVEGLPDSIAAADTIGFTYLTVVNTGLAYVLWLRGLERLPAGSVSFLGLASPLTAAVLGFVALDQRLTPVQLIGMGIALASMLLGQRVGKAQASRPGPPPSCDCPTPPLRDADAARELV